jgi:large subunit ribosomal protein L6
VAKYYVTFSKKLFELKKIMSRIGKQPVSLPKGVTINVAPNNTVTVKGPKGELTRKVDADIKITVGATEALVERPSEQKRHKALHGLYRALLANMVKGVSEGYTTKMELVGVGFKAAATGQNLDLSVGYSHNIIIVVPKEIKVKAETEKGSNPIVTLESHDNELLGAIAAKIRSFRSPEPYKGKGIKFVGEQLRRKAGKTAGK